MQCRTCGFASPPGMKFCGQCGTSLLRPCPSCGADNPPTFRFCGFCGTTLEGVPSAPRPPAATGAPEQDAERRQLTVMFCDLVGSTSLSYQLDAEALREVVRSYQATCTRIIEAFDGHVAQYLGDGILAYFGYPVALEGEASRAVRAGLGIVRKIADLNEVLERSHGINLGVRVGLHTGLVVVGEIGAGQRREHLAMGETPNVAARIQGYADPNTVVISGETHRIVHQEFEVEDLGARTIRGIPTPVRLYSVLDALAHGVVGIDASEPDEIVIGREQESVRLDEAWRQARSGSGQVVVVSGEAGVGKSALVRDFVRRVDRSGCTMLRTRCLPYFRNTAYQPLLELLQRRMEYQAAMTADEKLERLASFLPDDEAGRQSLPLFATLLGLGGGDEAETMTPQRKQERIRSVMLQIFLRDAERHALLLSVEDVQWADPSTLDLLGLLVKEVPEHRILVLLTHRRDYQLPWPSRAWQTRVELGRLQPEHAARIIARVADDKPLPEEVQAQILGRTDGVPLFVEELTKMVLESGLLRERNGRFELVGGSILPLAIPATLHDSLEARLDHLATTKDLAQVGSVMGREFSYELLRAVTGLEDEPLRASLERLIDAELLYQSGDPPNATYTFKHALVQEAAYQSLLKGPRQVYHLKVARAIEERFPEQARAHPELMAQHFAAGGQIDRAVEKWTEAGRLAVERSAVREAVIHLQQGLELLLDLDPGEDRDRFELALLLALGPALIATRGHTSDEVRDLYLSAQALVDQVGTHEQQFEVLAGLFTAHFVRSELDEARELAEELLVLSEFSGDRGSEMAAHVAIGAALLGRGQLREAVRYLDRGLELYDPAQHFALAHGAGQDFGVVALLYGAYCRSSLGQLAQAAEQARQGVELARSLQHPHSLAFALALAGNLYFFLRQPGPVLPTVDELRRLAELEGFYHWLVEVPALEGWALVELGRPEEGLVRLAATQQQAMDEADTFRALTRLRIRAEAFLRAGRVEEAAKTIQRVLASDNEVESVWWRCEAYRIHGCCLARMGRTEDALAELRRAVDAAVAADVPTYLLRALVELERHGSDPFQRAEVRRRLVDALRSFGEGGHFADLADAAAALERLAPTAEREVDAG